MEKAIAAIGTKEALNNVKDVQLKGTANLMGQSLEMKKQIVLFKNCYVKSIRLKMSK